MGWWVWLLRAGAMLLSFGAGFCLGRTPPGWQIDQRNEDVVGLRNSFFFAGQGLQGLGGHAAILFFQGAPGTVLLLLGAFLCAAFGWLDPRPPVEDAPPASILSRILTSQYFYMLVAGLVGYSISRTTDKGPVGPLE